MNKSLNGTLIGSVACLAILLPHAAYAYVGPGAGLSLLGALWALLVAIAAAVAFVVAWPIRRMRRRKREERERALAAEGAQDAAAPPAPDTDNRRPRPVPAEEATEPRRP